MCVPMDVVVLSDAAAVADEAARQVVALASSAIEARGRFTVALSGGATPRAMHARLASTHRNDVDWSRVDFFWSDERAVPPDHPDSNFGMARDTLLAPLAVRPERMHRMAGEDPDPAHAAGEYARELTSALPGPVPLLDLVLLGMGTDGHTASLFPNTPALDVDDRFVVANNAPQPPIERITLTFPVLLAAHAVRVVVAGAGKAQTLATVLHGPSEPRQFPSQRLAGARGDLKWLVDAAAARS